MNLDILVSPEKNWNEIQTKDSKNRNKIPFLRKVTRISVTQRLLWPYCPIETKEAENPFLP